MFLPSGSCRPAVTAKKSQAGGRTKGHLTVNAVSVFSRPPCLRRGRPMVLLPVVCRVFFGVAHGPPRQLEGFPASFPRDLSRRPLSGDVGYREGLVQPDQPQGRPP